MDCRAWVSACIAVASAACIGGGGSGKPQGELGGACFPNATCDGELSCISELCVDDSDDSGYRGGNGGGYQGGTGATGGGTGAIGGGTGAIGGGTGATGGGTGATGGGTGAVGGATGGVGGGTGGMGGGTGGMGGGTGGMGGNGTVHGACYVQAVADGNSGACAGCLCTVGSAGCLDEITRCGDDPLCSALAACSQANDCSGDCCLCGATCDPLGGNINAGPCSQETGDAAGVGTPDAFLNGAMIEPACAPGGGTPCAWSNELGNCEQQKCAAECGAAPSCP